VGAAQTYEVPYDFVRAFLTRSLPTRAGDSLLHASVRRGKEYARVTQLLAAIESKGRPPAEEAAARNDAGRTAFHEAICEWNDRAIELWPAADKAQQMRRRAEPPGPSAPPGGGSTVWHLWVLAARQRAREEEEGASGQEAAAASATSRTDAGPAGAGGSAAGVVFDPQEYWAIGEHGSGAHVRVER
jgi:hypothetical protein